MARLISGSWKQNFSRRWESLFQSRGFLWRWSTPMRDCNVAEMKKSGCTVLLTACPETILQRTKDDHDRPLLEKNKSIEFIAELMEKRREKYEAAADIIIETDGKNKKEICEELVRKVIAWSERR